MACSRMPKCNVLAARVVGLEIARAGEGQAWSCSRGRDRRASEEPGNVLGQNVQHLAGGVTPGDALGIGGENGRLRSHPAGSSRRCIWSTSVARSGYCALYLANSSFHSWWAWAPRAPMPVREVFIHAIGNQELRVLRPSIGALGQAHFFDAQRLAVRGGGVLLVRGSVADVAVEHDEGGPMLWCRGRWSSACSMRSISLASPTRSTFHP